MIVEDPPVLCRNTFDDHGTARGPLSTDPRLPIPERRRDGQHQRMPRLAVALSSFFVDLARAQAGAVSRGQALEHGMTDGQVEAMLAARRWQAHLPGVYLTFTGPVPPNTLVWGGLLYAGAGATAGLGTSAWLWGMRGDLPSPLEISVPFERKVRDQPGLHVASRRHLQTLRHPVAVPPRTRIEETVLDLVDQAEADDDVVAVITGACQRRLTSAARLARASQARTRLRRRALVVEVLDDVRAGVQSPLERHYLHVERAHGLPVGERNRLERARGRHTYRDVRYVDYATVVELDGNAAHLIENRELDRARDNDVAESGRVTLRYGWKPVVGSPCAVAAQVGRVLKTRGWPGQIRPCGRDCSATG